VYEAGSARGSALCFPALAPRRSVRVRWVLGCATDVPRAQCASLGCAHVQALNYDNESECSNRE